MCWEYEEEYGICFDDLVGKWYEDNTGEVNLVTLLEKCYNMQINNYHEFEMVVKGYLFQAFSELHQRKIIQPKEPNPERRIGGPKDLLEVLKNEEKEG